MCPAGLSEGSVFSFMKKIRKAMRVSGLFMKLGHSEVTVKLNLSFLFSGLNNGAPVGPLNKSFHGKIDLN